MGHTFLIAVDAHSKWPEVVPMTTTTSNHTITVLRQMFSAYGLPQQLVTENPWPSVYFICNWICNLLCRKWHQACQNFTVPPIIQWVGWALRAVIYGCYEEVWQRWSIAVPSSCHFPLDLPYNTECYHQCNPMRIALRTISLHTIAFAITKPCFCCHWPSSNTEGATWLTFCSAKFNSKLNI